MVQRRIVCIAAGTAEAAACRALAAGGSWEVRVAADLRGAQRLLDEAPADAGLVVAGALDAARCEQLDAFLAAHEELEWVGAFDAASLALPACRRLIVDRLFDYHTLPLDLPRLIATLGHAIGHAEMRRSLADREAGDDATPIVGTSPAIRAMRQQIARIAKVDAPVLVLGESGSGKELAAQAVHRLSARSAGPFVAVNCGAIQSSLIQSELFGHARGAFTGADRDKRGFIEAAGGGTLFLDEIGDLSLELQVNLLRFLQEKTIHRVGSTQSIRVDVRVIAATHVDLEDAVAARRFREDLFYRLNVLPLRVPPLRERGDDIERLAHHFFSQFASEKNARLKGFGRPAVLAMQRHAWPGNVRELINRVRRAMVLAEGRLVAPSDLGLDEPEEPAPADALDAARTDAERSAIFVSLQQTGRNVTHAARRLGVSRMTLYRLMAKHGITA